MNRYKAAYAIKVGIVGDDGIAATEEGSNYMRFIGGVADSKSAAVDQPFFSGEGTKEADSVPEEFQKHFSEKSFEFDIIRQFGADLVEFLQDVKREDGVEFATVNSGKERLDDRPSFALLIGESTEELNGDDAGIQVELHGPNSLISLSGFSASSAMRLDTAMERTAKP